MNRVFGLVAWIVAVTITPTQAYAYCVGTDQSLPNYRPDYYSVQKEFGRAKFVVEALVQKETWIGDDGKPKPLSAPYNSGQNRPWGIAAPYMGAWYDIQVTRTFKGKAPPHLRLFSENSTGRFWLNEGDRYLLFVSEGPFEAPISRAATIDTCGNSARLSGSRVMLRQVERLAARRF